MQQIYSQKRNKIYRKMYILIPLQRKDKLDLLPEVCLFSSKNGKFIATSQIRNANKMYSSQILIANAEFNCMCVL